MIWLVGARGMLGSDIRAELLHRGLEHRATDMDVDITDPGAVRGFVKGLGKLDWVVNAAAYTNVDLAEKERNKAFAINADGVRNLAEVVSGMGAKIIHFSTDYVFDGRADRPYKEGDPTNPLGVYGQSKATGEEKLVQATDRYFIFRISWLYGPNGKNFVNTMLRLFKERDRVDVINDQVGAPTYTGILASNVVDLIQADSRQFGLYHYQDRAGDGITWFTFARGIRDLALEAGLIAKKVALRPITSDQYPFVAARPMHTVMDTTRVREMLGFRIKDWNEALKQYIDGIVAARK